MAVIPQREKREELMMAFQPADRFVWDFWTVRDGATTHLFYLTAPRNIGEPDQRHFHAVIGHATSTNLVDWQDHGFALTPSIAPAWDDGTTWTGSVIRRSDGRWMMFYTGTSKREAFKIQRIGAAVSDDLFAWHKVSDNPLLVTDARWYETYDPMAWHDESWRDPWVYPDPSGQGWRMLFTARAKAGPARGRGVIGQAWSPDLTNWTCEAPLAAPMLYGEMEVPQLFALDGWWFCLFCNAHRNRLADYTAAATDSGTHYLRSRTPNGPFELVEHRFVCGDAGWRLYAGRMVAGADGRPCFMAFLNYDTHGHFIGGISDPMTVHVTPDGLLRIDASRYGIEPRPA